MRFTSAWSAFDQPIKQLQVNRPDEPDEHGAFLLQFLSSHWQNSPKLLGAKHTTALMSSIIGSSPAKLNQG